MFWAAPLVSLPAGFGARPHQARRPSERRLQQRREIDAPYATVTNPGPGQPAYNAPTSQRLLHPIVLLASAVAAAAVLTWLLPAGQYEMKVEVPGFKTYIRNGLTVDVAQTYRVDVVLEVGTTEAFNEVLGSARKWDGRVG